MAALYVDPRGVYSGRPDVEPWGLPDRDAREYAGPWPVVAHPPCQLWTNLAAVNFKRYGGEHNRPGNDGGCFASALDSVRRWSGVLEHPAGSQAWERFGLLRPTLGVWLMHAVGQWVTEVHQAAYGHRARKRTWLLYVGSDPPVLDWRPLSGTHQCGWFDRVKPTLGKVEASATPPAFAEILIAMARSAAV